MSTLEEVNEIRIGINEVEAVVRNQEPISSELLNAYEGKPDQFDLLVKIMAEAQGVDSNSARFVEFIKTGEINWTKWALVAKNFRQWLRSTQYSYKYSTPERLAELYLEHLEQQRG